MTFGVFIGMNDLHNRLLSDEPPSLAEVRLWMKGWTPNMTLENYQFALGKVLFGDTRWEDHLEEIRKSIPKTRYCGVNNRNHWI